MCVTLKINTPALRARGLHTHGSNEGSVVSEDMLIFFIIFGEFCFEYFEDFFWRILRILRTFFGGFWGFRGPLARSAGVFWGFWGFILRILRILMILRIFLRIFLLQKSPKLSKILQNSPKTMKKIHRRSAQEGYTHKTNARFRDKESKVAVDPTRS